MLSAVEQRAGFLATLQHSIYRPLTSTKRTQERYKERDFNRRLRKGRGMIKTRNYVFVVILEGITKTSKLRHAVEGP